MTRCRPGVRRRLLLTTVLWLAPTAAMAAAPSADPGPTAQQDETAAADADTASGPARRPNLVLVLVDDLGWSDTGVSMTDAVPAAGRWHTPHLEQLASRGMRFSDAYASAPVCTPTRTSIMTGRSPGQSRITYWTLHRDRDTSAAFPGLRAPPWRTNGLDADEVTLPRLLRDAGYRTIHVGKAHFAARDTAAADPTTLGFDVNVAGHAAGAPGSYRGRDAFSVAGRTGDPDRGPSVWDVPGLEEYHGCDVHLTDVLAVEACAAIDDALDHGVPFFLNFAPYAVHTPIMADPTRLARYAGLDEREAAYGTMIESVDAALGAIVDTLERRGAVQDTVIVFTSDNGGLSAHARGAAPGGGRAHVHNAPLRSGKGSAYEGGTRVPQVIAWPGVVTPGSATDVPVVSHDLFPTLLAMAAVPVPASHGPRVEGRDLVPLLRGDEAATDALRRRAIHWHQPHFWGVRGPGIEPFTAVRRGRWKLIWFHGDGRCELYDVVGDPGELTNLAPYRPADVARLAADLRAWMEDRDVQRSIDTVTGEPVDGPAPPPRHDPDPS